MKTKLLTSLFIIFVLTLSCAFAASFPVEGSKSKDLKQLKTDMEFVQKQTPFLKSGMIQFPYTYEYYALDNRTYTSTSKYDVFTYPLKSYTLCLNQRHTDGKKLINNDQAYCLSVINRVFVAKVKKIVLKQYTQIQNDDHEPKQREPEFVIGNLKP
jgi:hypothetical protein